MSGPGQPRPCERDGASEPAFSGSKQNGPGRPWRMKVPSPDFLFKQIQAPAPAALPSARTLAGPMFLSGPTRTWFWFTSGSALPTPAKPTADSALLVAATLGRSSKPGAQPPSGPWTELPVPVGRLEMPGILGERCTLPFGGISGMEGLLQLGGGNGLACRDIPIPVQRPFMSFLEVDGLPGSLHGSALISGQRDARRSSNIGGSTEVL